MAAAVHHPSIQPLYQAPWPASLDPNNASWQEIAVEALALALQIIFYPVYFVYCALQKVVNYALLPSAYMNMIETQQQQRERRAVVDNLVATSRQVNSQFQAKRCNFRTPDGVQLDGLFIKSRNSSLATHKVVVFCCPNGVSYERLCPFILLGLRGNGGPAQPRPQSSLPFDLPPRSRTSSSSTSKTIHTLSSPSSVAPRPNQPRKSQARVFTLADCRRQDEQSVANNNGSQNQSVFDKIFTLFKATQELMAGIDRHLSPSEQRGDQDSSAWFNGVMGNGCLDPDVSVLFVNYRGVGDSQGKAAISKLPLDIYSSYKYLIDREGIQPSSIAFYGMSMGGLAGPCGAALVQEEYGDFVGLGGISLIAPASLSSAAKHLITSKYGKILGFLAGSAVSVLQTDLDGPAAWQRLRGPKLAVHGRQDDLVLPAASLAQAVQTDNNPSQTRFLNGYGHHMEASNEIGFPQLRQALGLPLHS